MNLAECWSSVMQADVREMCAASMSQDGLKPEVRYSVRDFVIWMRSLEETTDWLQNLQMRQKKLDVTFAAVIGTPVPAVIGTDYRALERMLSKKTDLSVLTVNTDGMELYDKGEEKAYLALFEKFSDKNEESEDMNDKDRPRIGIIGMTPQDVSDLKAADKIRKVYADQGMRAICYGMGDGTG